MTFRKERKSKKYKRGIIVIKKEGRKGEGKSVWLVVISDGILIHTVEQ